MKRLRILETIVGDSGVSTLSKYDRVLLNCVKQSVDGVV